MKKIALLIIILFAAEAFGAVEDGIPSNYLDYERPSHSNLAVGMEFTNYGGDFGIGANITSPYFHHWALRLTGGESFFKGIPVGSVNQTTSQYGTIKLGLIGSSLTLSNLFSLYGGGGVVVFIPSGSLSNSTYVAGYGGFGFECMMSELSHSAFFLELGGMGGGTADKLSGQPTFGTGFSASVGDRYYF